MKWLLAAAAHVRHSHTCVHSSDAGISW